MVGWIETELTKDPEAFRAYLILKYGLEFADRFYPMESDDGQ